MTILEMAVVKKLFGGGGGGGDSFNSVNALFTGDNNQVEVQEYVTE